VWYDSHARSVAIAPTGGTHHDIRTEQVCAPSPKTRARTSIGPSPQAHACVLLAPGDAGELCEMPAKSETCLYCRKSSSRVEPHLVPRVAVKVASAHAYEEEVMSPVRPMAMAVHGRAFGVRRELRLMPTCCLAASVAGSAVWGLCLVGPCAAARTIGPAVWARGGPGGS